MNRTFAKQPGPQHGQALLRGLDRFKGAPTETGPLVTDCATCEPPPMPESVRPPAAGRFGRIFERSRYNPDPGAVHKLADSMMEQNFASGDNPKIPIGLTFLGQFVDHDLTLDATTLFGQQQDPQAIVDFRTPNFDLDNLYGAGPTASRYLYDVRPPFNLNPVKLLLDAGRPFDLPRNSANTALIGDPRNDENFLVSQLHLAFIKFHNAVVDRLVASGSVRYDGAHGNLYLFQDASQTVRWHYQWILLHELLPALLGADVVNQVLAGPRKLFGWRERGAQYPFMPVEFSTAAYRLGHTMLRQDYAINDQRKMDLFDLPVFGTPRIDESYRLDFTRFFDFPGRAPAQRARLFDAKITQPVFKLPFIDPVQDPPPSLPERNMLRAQLFGVPSGQEVAKQLQSLGIQVPVYTNEELGIGNLEGLGGQAPLFYYILKESEFTPAYGAHLGPVGGRIVAEVFIGLLSDIEGNYLHDDSGWTPTLPSAKPGTFQMTDLLTLAGVV